MIRLRFLRFFSISKFSFPFYWGCILCFFYCLDASGQDSTLVKKKKVSVSGIVLPSRTPENGFFAQGGLVGIYKTEQSDTTLRASNTYLYGMYSQLNQWRISLGGDIFTPKEKYYLSFWYYSSFVPEKYFGLGIQALPDSEEFISYSAQYANTIVLRNINRNNFLGIVHNLENTSSIDFQANGILDRLKPLGYEGYFINGLGLHFRHDSRDFLLSANKGAFAELSVCQFSPAFLSDYTFLTYKVDVRKYINVLPLKGQVFALQFLHSGADGNVPLRWLPNIVTRAYHPNLYRANIATWIQAEYRIRIWKWLGSSFFGGIAQCDNNYSDMSDSPIRPNYGAGLRFKLIPKYNMNLRIEYGIGQRTSNYYIAFYDAF